MSKRILRNYRYISRDSPGVKTRKVVISGDTFPEANLPFFKEPQRRRKQTPTGTPGGSKSVVNDSQDYSASAIANGIAGGPSSESLKPISEKEMTDKLRVVENEGYNRGFQAGLAAGRAEWEPTSKSIGAAFEKAIVELKAINENMSRLFEQSLYDLAMQIAEKVIGDCVAKSSEAAVTNVQNCLAMLGGSGDVSIKLNPTDYEIVQQLLPNLEKINDGRFKIRLIPDDVVNRGGCFVEHNGSVIDARIETQIQNIKKHLHALT